MMAVSVMLSTALLLAGALLLSGNRRSPAGWILVAVSVIPPVVLLSLAKALFTWLALIGLAGFLVAVFRGLTARDEKTTDIV